MELRGRVEALQVCSPLWGSCTLMMTNVSRTRSASVDFLEAGRCQRVCCHEENPV